MRTAAWISIRVDLIGGRGAHLWPRPGRLFAASSNHTFDLLAAAIDDAFARWDRSHLHEFELNDGTRIGIADPDDDALLDERRLNLSRVKLGDQFIYVFDLGDDWAHLCSVAKSSIDLALRDAFRKMRHFLMTTQGLTEDEAVSLMSVGVDFGVTQVVDGNWGIHAIVKKALFAGASS